MLRMEHQAGVQHVLHIRGGLRAIQHVEEVPGVGELLPRSNGLIAVPQPIVPGDDRRKPGREQGRPLQIRLLVGVVPRHIHRAQGRDHGPQGIHGSQLRRNDAEQVQDGGRQRTVGPHLLPESLELRFARQLPVPE